MASCHWYGNRTNHRKLGKLSFDWQKNPVNLWRHKCAFLVIFILEKLIIFVNSIKRIRAWTFLGLTSETTVCNNLTAKVSIKRIIYFSICASLKLKDLISLISTCRNVQDHKLDWDTVDTFLMVSLKTHSHLPWCFAHCLLSSVVTDRNSHC